MSRLLGLGWKFEPNQSIQDLGELQRTFILESWIYENEIYDNTSSGQEKKAKPISELINLFGKKDGDG